ncbi:MAG: hypothetical protein M1818_004403 [Claussenomyces sp. TS43310]|nr:MAG: hypothetical protein M1818_004403 [Claussenomyces sp. TS43310]
MTGLKLPVVKGLALAKFKKLIGRQTLRDADGAFDSRGSQGESIRQEVTNELYEMQSNSSCISISKALASPPAAGDLICRDKAKYEPCLAITFERGTVPLSPACAETVSCPNTKGEAKTASSPTEPTVREWNIMLQCEKSISEASEKLRKLKSQARPIRERLMELEKATPLGLKEEHEVKQILDQIARLEMQREALQTTVAFSQERLYMRGRTKIYDQRLKPGSSLGQIAREYALAKEDTAIVLIQGTQRNLEGFGRLDWR